MHRLARHLEELAHIYVYVYALTLVLSLSLCLSIRIDLFQKRNLVMWYLIAGLLSLELYCEPTYTRR